MVHNNAEVLAHWNKDDVQSMYDKYLLDGEIELIRQRITPNAKVLDAGCGEGEGTIVYSAIPGTRVTAVDFSETRLKKATERLRGRGNVELRQVDFLGEYELDGDFDFVVSQRFLINLMEWELQSKVLVELMARLKPGGRFLMLEGSQPGVDSLNELRAALGLAPIPVQWHNWFFDDEQLIDHMQAHGFALAEVAGLGTYFALTRGIRPALDQDLNWDSEFNRSAASPRMDELLDLGTKFSRLKLWVFTK
ncbi:MAG: methyltransferase domain-containing protein [Pyrinomonadaceae bacterium]